MHEEANATRGEGDQWMLEPFGRKFMVRLRQRLGTDELAEVLCTQLSDKMDELATQGNMLVFEDFDISQNPLSRDAIEKIVTLISDDNVHVERFRAFGCSAFDDEAASLVARWFASVNSSNVPLEIHLSDCAITEFGFLEIMEALKLNEVFPAVDPREAARGKLPLYLRMENNYINEEVMHDAVQEGTAMMMRKIDRAQHSDTIKCRLLVRESGRSFQQNKGPPPAPEDAREPKPFTYGSKGKGDGRSSFQDKDRGWGHSNGKTRDFGGDQAPPWQKLSGSNQIPCGPKAPSRVSSAWESRTSTWDTRNFSSTWDNAAAPGAARSGSVGTAGKGQGSAGRGGPGWGGSATHKEADYGVKQRAPWEADHGVKRRAPWSASWEAPPEKCTPKADPRGIKGRYLEKLPHPWEQHWSHEHKMHFYYNSETKKSCWDVPPRPPPRKGGSSYTVHREAWAGGR